MIGTSVRLASNSQHRRPIQPAWHRVRQFAAALSSSPDPRVDTALRDLLANDRQWTLLERLSPFDRAHHLRVHWLLQAGGCVDDDLLRAALLHDVGKADERGRVRLGHRVARVLLKRSAPSALARLRDRGRSGLIHGLYLAEHHAQLGARLALDAGASERCAWLIEHHEQRGAAEQEPALGLLIAADEALAR
jgi:hypothetical protein